MIGAVHEKPFGRGLVGEGIPEVKAQIPAAVAHAPRSPRVEKGGLGARRNAWKPLHIDVDVGTAAVISEGLVLSAQHYR